MTARASVVSSAERPCPSCDGVARRAAVNHVAVNGFAFVPYNQRPIHLDRGMNALMDVQRDAERAGVAAPNLFAEAERRVVSGQAQAEAGTR
jgi:hypothetical protein